MTDIADILGGRTARLTAPSGAVTAVRYRVHLPAHGTTRDTVTLREALAIARPSARDGWGDTRIVRLTDGRVLYRCEPTEHGTYTLLRRV